MTGYRTEGEEKGASGKDCAEQRGIDPRSIERQKVIFRDKVSSAFAAIKRARRSDVICPKSFVPSV